MSVWLTLKAILQNFSPRFSFWCFSASPSFVMPMASMFLLIGLTTLQSNIKLEKSHFTARWCFNQIGKGIKSLDSFSIKCTNSQNCYLRKLLMQFEIWARYQSQNQHNAIYLNSKPFWNTVGANWHRTVVFFLWINYEISKNASSVCHFTA